MKRPKTFLIVAISVFLIINFFWGHDYVMTRINSPTAEGYERYWQWQLVFFILTRFPITLIILGLTIFVERKLFRKK